MKNYFCIVISCEKFGPTERNVLTLFRILTFVKFISYSLVLCVFIALVLLIYYSLMLKNFFASLLSLLFSSFENLLMYTIEEGQSMAKDVVLYINILYYVY